MLVAADNKFRVCCVLKTWLLMVTVAFIVKLDKMEDLTWRLVFGALSAINILSVILVTARFNARFWNRLNSLKYHYKFGHLLYFTYLISLITTNCCSFYVVGNALWHSHIAGDSQQSQFADPKVWSYSIFTLVWIVCAVLYHNEFIRFQYDSRVNLDAKISGKKTKKSMTTSMRSLYYFMNLTVSTSFGTMVIYAYYIWSFEDVEYDYYMVIYMVFAGIVCLNGMVALFVLDINANLRKEEGKTRVLLQSDLQLYNEM